MEEEKKEVSLSAKAIGPKTKVLFKQPKIENFEERIKVIRSAIKKGQVNKRPDFYQFVFDTTNSPITPHSKISQKLSNFITAKNSEMKGRTTRSRGDGRNYSLGHPPATTYAPQNDNDIDMASDQYIDEEMVGNQPQPIHMPYINSRNVHDWTPTMASNGVNDGQPAAGNQVLPTGLKNKILNFQNTQNSEKVGKGSKKGKGSKGKPPNPYQDLINTHLS